MQVAKLFASLGFQIDTAELSKFESLIKGAQTTMSKFAHDIQTVNLRLKTTQSRMKAIDSKFDSASASKAAGKLHQSINRYVKAMEKWGKEAPKIETVMTTVGTKSDILANKLDNGTAAWTRYSTSVATARDRLREVTAAIQQRRSLTNPSGTGGSRGGSGNNGSGNPNSGNNGGYNGGSSGSNNASSGGFFAAIPKFSKAMVGQMAFGGALGAGYAVKSLVTTGRDLDSMIFKVQAVSRGAAEFNTNLAYVRKTAQYLAVDVEEFGNSYAQIFQGTKAKYSQSTVQNMFTGFNEYFKTLKMSAADQQGALRGISQMFGKEKVQAQELILQVGQRTAGIVQIFAKANDMTVAELLKTMELGKTTTDMVVKAGLAAAEEVKVMGTLSEALKTSASRQIQFNNTMKWFAHTVLKVIDPALAKMFQGLEKLLEIIQPIMVAIGTIIAGIALLAELILTMDWTTWATLAVVALTAVQLWLFAVAGAAGGAKVGVALLGIALRSLRAALPIVAFVAFLHVVGQISQWYKDMAAGKETFTWMDIWGAKMVLMFLKVETSIWKVRNLFRELGKDIYSLNTLNWGEMEALEKRLEGASKKFDEKIEQENRLNSISNLTSNSTNLYLDITLPSGEVVEKQVVLNARQNRTSIDFGNMGASMA